MKTPLLTSLQMFVLQAVASDCVHFDASVASRGRPLRVMLALERKGLVEDVGSVVMSDGDGFALQPERYRHGWAITPAGKKAIGEVLP